MSLATPVSKDGFHFNGDLYVEVGNYNRHKRATVAELNELLRPKLSKKKTADPVTDRVGKCVQAYISKQLLPYRDLHMFLYTENVCPVS